MASIKQKEKWPFGKRIGQIRISSQDLLELLEKWNVDKGIVAESKKHAFSSLSDIRENLQIFAGELKIEMRFSGEHRPYSIVIRLENCAVVRVFPSENEGEITLEKVVKELSEYRVPVLGFLPIIPMFAWAIIFVILMMLAPSDGELILSKLSWPSEKSKFLLYLGALVISILGFATSAFPQVYYNPRQTFWQRNKDKIVLGAIMLLMGVFLTKALEWLAKGLN